MVGQQRGVSESHPGLSKSQQTLPSRPCQTEVCYGAQRSGSRTNSLERSARDVLANHARISFKGPVNNEKNVAG